MTDVGAMGYLSSQTAAVSVEFQLLCLKDGGIGAI